MIIKLADEPQEKQEAYKTYYNDVLIAGKVGFKHLRPTDDFDQSGLRFPLEYLQAVGVTIVFMLLEYMSEFVDQVCKTFIDNNDEKFITEQFVDVSFDLETDYPKLTATAIGCLGYVALHCKNEKAVAFAMDTLQKIFVKQKGIILQQINDSLV